MYAIATILYQCLAGRTPFDADSPMALLMQHAYETPPPLLSIPRASYVPPAVAAAVMHNLAKAADERAPDARNFGRELVEAARAGGLSPDDLVPRSTLLGQRGAHASFVSIQRTKQMELSAETAAIIGARGAQASSGAPALATPAPALSTPVVSPSVPSISISAPSASIPASVTPAPATSTPAPSDVLAGTPSAPPVSSMTVPARPSIPQDPRRGQNAHSFGSRTHRSHPR